MRLYTALITSISVLALAACAEQEGPMEQAGAKADQAVNTMQEEAKEMGDDLKDTARSAKQNAENMMDDAGDKAEELGDNMKDAANEAMDGVEDAADELKDDS